MQSFEYLEKKRKLFTGKLRNIVILCKILKNCLVMLSPLYVFYLGQGAISDKMFNNQSLIWKENKVYKRINTRKNSLESLIPTYKDYK